MDPYVITPWVYGIEGPPINPPNLLKIENGIKSVTDYVLDFSTGLGVDIGVIDLVSNWYKLEGNYMGAWSITDEFPDGLNQIQIQSTHVKQPHTILKIKGPVHTDPLNTNYESTLALMPTPLYLFDTTLQQYLATWNEATNVYEPSVSPELMDQYFNLKSWDDTRATGTEFMSFNFASYGTVWEDTDAPPWGYYEMQRHNLLKMDGNTRDVRAYVGFTADDYVHTENLEVYTGATLAKALVYNNVNDALPALTVDKHNAGATGAVADFQFNGVRKVAISSNGIELGTTSDTTISRASAGVVAVEGAALAFASATPSPAGLIVANSLGLAEATQTLWDFTKAVKTPPNLLREIVEAASCGAATVIHDDLGYPSMMWICKPVMCAHLHADFGTVDSISTLAVATGGTGYSAGDILTIDAKTGTARVLTAPGGVVATVQIVNPGSGYTAGTKATTVAPSGGADCTLTVAIGPIFPSHLVAGVFKSEIFLPMFNATEYNGGAGARAVVWPGRFPTCSKTFDQEKTLCTAKGAGWHMMTMWEQAYLMWMAMKNQTEPRGNTYYGRAYESGYEYEAAVRYDGLMPGTASGTPKHRNGSGPSKWNHNHERWGIADLVGNVWRRVDGMKIVEGQVFMPADNDYSLAEASWPAQGAFLDGSGKLWASEQAETSSSVAHTSQLMDASYDALDLAVRRRLMKAGLSLKLAQASANPFAPKGTLYVDNSLERIPLVGGSWSSASAAGLAALYLGVARSHAGSDIGFRPAFISP
jgi:hypothetical protein